MTLWRISNHADLSGDGGRRIAARWHTAGAPVVYLTSSPASALLEALVHELSLDELPESYQWLEVGVEDSVRVAPPPELPSGWQHETSKTRALGDGWLRDAATPLLEVPSVIVPKTVNYLFNPRHPKAHGVHITSVIRYPLDLRFVGPL